VKEDLFYQLLNLHGVELSQEARTIINATYKKNEKINYPDALTVICIDLETAANLNERKWTVRKEAEKKQAARNGAFDTQSMISTYSRTKSVAN
jgi:hypothetical protein